MLNFNDLKIKVNKNIILRTLSEIELQELANECFIPKERKHLEQYLDSFYNYKDAEEYYQTRLRNKVREEQSSGLSYLLGIFFNDKLVGRIRTHEINYENQKVEVGYFLFSDFIGKGIAGIALRAVEEHLFDEVRINRIELFIDNENQASLKMAALNNYTYEGTLRDEYYNNYFKSLRDTQVWSKLKRERNI